MSKCGDGIFYEPECACQRCVWITGRLLRDDRDRANLRAKGWAEAIKAAAKALPMHEKDLRALKPPVAGP